MASETSFRLKKDFSNDILTICTYQSYQNRFYTNMPDANLYREAKPWRFRMRPLLYGDWIVSIVEHCSQYWTFMQFIISDHDIDESGYIYFYWVSCLVFEIKHCSHFFSNDPRMISFLCPHLRRSWGAYWFRVVRPSVRPFVTLFDACHILWTVQARVFEFHVWIPHGKIADLYFLSHPSYLPFWSYIPLKKIEWNLVSKIFRKVFKLGTWNLFSW